jgi:hypothetical protein
MLQLAVKSYPILNRSYSKQILMHLGIGLGLREVILCTCAALITRPPYSLFGIIPVMQPADQM